MRYDELLEIKINGEEILFSKIIPEGIRLRISLQLSEASTKGETTKLTKSVSVISFNEVHFIMENNIMIGYKNSVEYLIDPSTIPDELLTLIKIYL